MFLLSGLILFIVVVSLVHVYHLFNWNNSLTSVDNVWVSSFECGFIGFSSAYSSFTYGFISFLVLFDLEVSLFLNFCFNSSIYSNFVFYYMFLIMLCLGFTFEILSGSIKWSM